MWQCHFALHMSTRSDTPLPRRPPPRPRAAPDGGFRLRQVLAAGERTGTCVKKTFDCNYCDKDMYYLLAQQVTAGIGAILAALSAFILRPELSSPTAAINLLTNLGKQVRKAVTLVPEVQDWWSSAAGAIKRRLNMAKNDREEFPLLSAGIGFGTNPSWTLDKEFMTFMNGWHAQTYNSPVKNTPWYSSMVPTEQQTDFATATLLLMMIFIIARKKVSENATIGQIVASINEGPERWIRLLGGFFRARAAHKAFGGETSKQWTNFSYYVYRATTDVLRGECDQPADGQSNVPAAQFMQILGTTLELEDRSAQQLLLTYHDI